MEDFKEYLNQSVVEARKMKRGRYNVLGDCVQRRGWNGKGMYLFLIDGDAVNQALYNYLDDPDNTKNNTSVRDAIYMLTADNQLVPWVASQTDLLAEDWVVVE